MLGLVAPTRHWSSQLGAIALLLVVLAACNERPKLGFNEQRKAFRTHIKKDRQAPSAYDPIKPVEWLETFEYSSDGLRLKGYRAHPTSTTLSRNGRAPGLLYLHGGFAIARQDMVDVIGFLRAGFAVYVPAYRAENGNPGRYELFFGELNDARAALSAVRDDPKVDPDRIVVLGHSAGGVLSSLLTFETGLPVLETASVGGIYTGQVFDFLELPFVDTEQERMIRLFLPNMKQMKARHLACVGNQDNARDATEMADLVAQQNHLPFEMVTVEGDHVSSLEPCVALYLERATKLVTKATPEVQKPRN